MLKLFELENLETTLHPAKLNFKKAFVIVSPYCQYVALKIYLLKMHFNFVVFKRLHF